MIEKVLSAISKNHTIAADAERRRTDDVQRYRTFGILSPNAWMAQCDDLGHGIKKVEPMTSKEVMRELIVFGLRMQAMGRRKGNTL
jgi:hypothetical protein